MNIPHLKTFAEIFTHPTTNNIMDDVRADVAEHSLAWEMADRERDAYNAEIMHMVVGAEVPVEAES